MSTEPTDIPSPIRNPQIKFTQLFINNEFVNSESGKTFPTINPATGDVICDLQEGDKADVDKAIMSAKAAFARHRYSTLLNAHNYEMKLIESHGKQCLFNLISKLYFLYKNNEVHGEQWMHQRGGVY